MKLKELNSHHKLYLSLAIALLSATLFYRLVATEMWIMVTWLSYVITNLLLNWLTILNSHPTNLRHDAHSQDSNRTVIFCFSIGSAFASLFALLMLFKGSSNDPMSFEFIIPIACVVSSWLLVHTLFTFRYAHFYYCDIDHDDGNTLKPDGLIFPEEDKPDYLDFIYFSFVVGMTFQVSDIQITSRRIRRLAWMHGLLSFVYNTIIVALTINILSNLLQQS